MEYPWSWRVFATGHGLEVRLRDVSVESAAKEYWNWGGDNLTDLGKALIRGDASLGSGLSNVGTYPLQSGQTTGAGPNVANARGQKEAHANVGGMGLRHLL